MSADASVARTPELLDLVRQLGAAQYTAGYQVARLDQAKADRAITEAGELFDRIAALVPQQPVQARDRLTEVRADRDRIVAVSDHLMGQLRAQLDEARAEVERLKSQVNAEIEQADEHAAWATRLADAAITRFGVRLTEEGGHEVWEAALAALTAQPDPLVLSLPEVPEGAVALVGVESGKRYVPGLTNAWRDEVTAQVMPLYRVLERERSVRVEMAPPREPRRWSKIDSTEDEPPLVDVEGHGSWKRSPGTDVYVHEGEERGLYSLADLRELGDVTEVFDDEPGGEQR